MKCTVMLDWLTFTVMHTKDPREVISQYLSLDPSIFVERDYGAHGYRGCLRYDDIKVLYNSYEGMENSDNTSEKKQEFMGVCVSLSGNGCRQYELLGGDVLNLAICVNQAEMVNVTRIDIACDDKEGALDTDLPVQYCKDGKIRSSCRNWNYYEGKKGKHDGGKTLYIGSAKSELRFRIYDKAKEHYDPITHPKEFNTHWVRLEMVLRRDNAKRTLTYISQNKDNHGLGECVASIINAHLQFIEHDDSNVSRCTVADWWQDFLETIKREKITHTEPVKHVMERKIAYVKRNLAPLLSVIQKAIGYTNFNKILSVGSLYANSEQQAMLEVYQAQTDKPHLGEILGRQFMLESEALYRHQYTRTEWGKCLDMGMTNSELEFTKQLNERFRLDYVRQDIRKIVSEWKEIDGWQDWDVDENTPFFARPECLDVPWFGEQLQFQGA